MAEGAKEDKAGWSAFLRYLIALCSAETPHSSHQLVVEIGLAR
jgi:hypothetical protein